MRAKILNKIDLDTEIQKEFDIPDWALYYNGTDAPEAAIFSESGEIGDVVDVYGSDEKAVIIYIDDSDEWPEYIATKANNLNNLSEYGGAGFSYGGGSSIFPVNRGGQMNRGGFGGAANMGGPNMMYTYEIKALNRNLQPLVMTPPEREDIHIGNDIQGFELNKRNDEIKVGVLTKIVKSTNGSLNYYVILDPDTNTFVKIDPTTANLVSKIDGEDPTQTRHEKERDKSKIDSPKWKKAEAGIFGESYYPKLDETYDDDDYWDSEDDDYDDSGETKVYGKEILPEEALEELKMYLGSDDDIVKVVPDPQVDGTYAAEIERMRGKKKEYVHLLWYSGGWDEVEFEKWPPETGEPRFFV